MKEPVSKFTKVFPLQLTPIQLTGARIVLEPMEDRHFEELLPLLNPSIWDWYTIQIRNADDFRNFLNRILTEQRAGRSLAFAIRERAGGRVIGSSRYLNVDSTNRTVEIGSTWFAPQWQRTFANTESKFQMLTHAFETLSCISVQFQTDVLNVRSRAAIERLGAKLDGVIRDHRICHDGRIRSSAFYSITHEEWAAVRDRLGMLLARP